MIQLLHNAQWLIFLTFLIPLWELGLLTAGVLHSLVHFKKNPDGCEKLIIRITSLGREPKLVQRTIDRIHSYRLTKKYGLPYEIWVIIEPSYSTDYTGAEVFVVPEGFKSRAVDKARALHYTLTIMQQRGLIQSFVKSLLLDDDTVPTERYILNSAYGDYDYCQGVTVVNREYGRGPWQHWLTSLLDGIRVRNCLIYCSCTQGISQKPLFVHGEGLCIRATAEYAVGWNWPIVASDDLVHGTNAAYQGYRWGYHLAWIQLVSPWTLKAALLQKHRWTWGNFMAIANRDILPASVAWPKAIKYGIGFVSIICSMVGGVLLFLGVMQVPNEVHAIFLVSLVTWFFSYGLCGWMNTCGIDTVERIRDKGRAPGERKPLLPWQWRYVGFRLWHALVATVLTPVTGIAPVLIIGLSVWMGKNRTRPPYKRATPGFSFVVIDKTHTPNDSKVPVPIR